MHGIESHACILQFPCGPIPQPRPNRCDTHSGWQPEQSGGGEVQVKLITNLAGVVFQELLGAAFAILACISLRVHAWGVVWAPSP